MTEDKSRIYSSERGGGVKFTMTIALGSWQFNLLAPELVFLILAHSVYKMWIIQEPNKLAL